MADDPISSEYLLLMNGLHWARDTNSWWIWLSGYVAPTYLGLEWVTRRIQTVLPDGCKNRHQSPQEGKKQWTNQVMRTSSFLCGVFLLYSLLYVLLQMVVLQLMKTLQKKGKSRLIFKHIQTMEHFLTKKVAFPFANSDIYMFTFQLVGCYITW